MSERKAPVIIVGETALKTLDALFDRSECTLEALISQSERMCRDIETLKRDSERIASNIADIAAQMRRLGA